MNCYRKATVARDGTAMSSSVTKIQIYPPSIIRGVFSLLLPPTGADENTGVESVSSRRCQLQSRRTTDS